MGRLRDGYESDFHLDVAEEVVDLFGMDEVILYKLDSSCDEIDPVYGEVIGTKKFKAYKTKAHYQDLQDTFEVSEIGSFETFEANIFFALRHLQGAGVPVDEDRDHVSEGDIVVIHWRGKRVTYDVIDVQRADYLNNSDTYVGYNCKAKRNTKFSPERNILGEVLE